EPRLPALAEVLPARRSVREFASRALPAADLGAVLRYAGAVTGQLWPAATEGLATAVLPFAVDGLAPGTYLVPTRAAPAAPPVGRALPELRRLYAAAPALVAICGDLPWLRSAAGPDYGGLLVAAGGLGHAVW